MPPPGEFRALSAGEVASLRDSPQTADRLPRQEPGTRPSAPLPYELAADGKLTADGRRFMIRFEARNKRFGKKSAGAPFIANSRHGAGDVRIRNYAVVAGDRLDDVWNLDEFAQGTYDITVHGPNGYFRQFRGDGKPTFEVSIGEVCSTAGEHGAGAHIEVHFSNGDDRNHVVTLTDNSYGAPTLARQIRAGQQDKLVIDTTASEGWYDISVGVEGFPRFNQSYAGRIESGEWGSSDPAIGRGNAQRMKEKA
jgi:phospholipase C